MSLYTLRKDKAVVEDLELGMGTVTQPRGEVTQINADKIPYSSSETITEAIDRKEDTSSANAKLATKADLNGNASEKFKVADGADNDDAVNKGQMDTELALKADKTYTDTELALKANEDNVLLKDGTSPTFSPVSPNQPATKKYVDDLVIDVGAGDMLKAIYDTGDTGAVDTTEAIGRAGTFLGKTPMNQVMRLSQSNVTDCNNVDDFGILIGTDVTNAPVSGPIGLEQLEVSGGKAQRLYSFNTYKWYDRVFDGSIWSGWNEWAAMSDVNLKVSKAGDVMAGQLKGITPVADEDLTRKDYVDGVIAPKADKTYVDSQDTSLQGNIDGVQTNLNSHTDKTDNPHSVTASQVGAPTGSWSWDGTTLNITIP